MGEKSPQSRYSFKIQKIYRRNKFKNGKHGINTSIVMLQSYVVPRLSASLQRIYGHHLNLVNRKERLIYQMTMHLLFLT